MAEVKDLLLKAREMRLMAENAGSEALGYRLRRQAHRFEREAETASRATPKSRTGARTGAARRTG
jgi:hypothetical protein